VAGVERQRAPRSLAYRGHRNVRRFLDAIYATHRCGRAGTSLTMNCLVIAVTRFGRGVRVCYCGLSRPDRNWMVPRRGQLKCCSLCPQVLDSSALEGALLGSGTPSYWFGAAR
jgi:hypothetical protein